MILKEKKGGLLVRRQGYISILLAAASFACFSFFLFFALIDMVLYRLFPVTISASSALSEIAIGLILLASLLFGFFGWKLAFVPILLASGVFYAEYLTPERLRYWFRFPFSSTTNQLDPFFFSTHTPFWLRPDVDAIGFFFLGFCAFTIWQIYSKRSGLVRTVAKIFLVPAVMIVIFEILIGMINPHNLESSVIAGFRINFVPAFFWTFKNIWLLDLSILVVALCSLELLHFKPVSNHMGVPN